MQVAQQQTGPWLRAPRGLLQVRHSLQERAWTAQQTTNTHGALFMLRCREPVLMLQLQLGTREMEAQVGPRDLC